MLGISYLTSITFQHFFCLGLFLFCIGEMTSRGSELLFEKSLSMQTTVLGFSILNLALLHYSFSEELLLAQSFLGILYLISYFFKKTENLIQKNQSRMSVYVFLAILLAIELVD